MLSDNVICGFDVRNEDMAISYLDSELPLDCLMDMDTGFNIDESALITPMRVERDGYSLDESVVTFQRSGSIWLSLLWTHLMMRFAVSPGWMELELRGGEFRCAWEAGCKCSGE